MTIAKSAWRRCQIAALTGTILVAGLLAGCASVNSNPWGRTAGSGPTPSPTAAAVRQVATEAPAARSENAGAPPAAVAGPSLPAETRSSDGGGVTVQVTPAGATGDEIALTAVLNTHSVDLSYDIQAIATLTDDQGHTYVAKAWDGGSGGHHLSGKLIFSNKPPLPAPGVKWVELELKGIAGVPLRSFRWNIG